MNIVNFPETRLTFSFLKKLAVFLTLKYFTFVFKNVRRDIFLFNCYSSACVKFHHVTENTLCYSMIHFVYTHVIVMYNFGKSYLYLYHNKRSITKSGETLNTSCMFIPIHAFKKSLDYLNDSPKSLLYCLPVLTCVIVYLHEFEKKTEYRVHVEGWQWTGYICFFVQWCFHIHPSNWPVYNPE